MWEPKPPGTLWATPGLLRDSFTFYIHIYGTYSRSTALIQLKTAERFVMKFRIGGSALKVLGRI